MGTKPTPVFFVFRDTFSSRIFLVFTCRFVVELRYLTEHRNDVLFLIIPFGQIRFADVNDLLIKGPLDISKLLIS